MLSYKIFDTKNDTIITNIKYIMLLNAYFSKVFYFLCNSYLQTKDLQIVKQVLRHSNVNITSKYAHIYNKMDKRYTTGINLNENVNEDKKKAHK